MAADQRLPVVLFCAGGIATPADASLVMQLGAEGVFVGSGIFKSEDPERRARAIVEATTAVGFDGESIFNQAPDHMFRGRFLQRFHDGAGPFLNLLTGKLAKVSLRNDHDGIAVAFYFKNLATYSYFRHWFLS